ISDNIMTGVDIFSDTDGTDTTGNIVQGNLIGTDLTGKLAIGNIVDGVLLSNAQQSTIGGTAAGAGNVIAANGQSGIDFALSAGGNVIQGNFIGTDISGTQSIPNVGDGLFLHGASGNTIGGTAAGARNVISSNNNGIRILGNSGGAGTNS